MRWHWWGYRFKRWRIFSQFDLRLILPKVEYVNDPDFGMWFVSFTIGQTADPLFTIEFDLRPDIEGGSED